MLGVIATIPVGLYPADVVISPDGARAYVVNESSGTVSVIDTATNTVTTHIPVPDYPLRAALSPDGAWLYVVSYPNDRVSVIDIATNAVIADITVSDDPREVTIHPDGTRLYVVCANAVKVIDTATTTITATIGVGVTIGGAGDQPRRRPPLRQQMVGRHRVGHRQGQPRCRLYRGWGTPARRRGRPRWHPCVRGCLRGRRHRRLGVGDRHRHQHGGHRHPRGH